MENLVHPTMIDFHRTVFDDGEPDEVIIRCDNRYIVVVKTLDGIKSDVLIYRPSGKPSRLMTIGQALSLKQISASIETVKSFRLGTPGHIILGALVAYNPAMAYLKFFG